MENSNIELIPLDKIASKIKHLNLAKLSKETGVHRTTLYKIIEGTIDPRYSTVRTLSNYLNYLSLVDRFKNLGKNNKKAAE